MKTAIVGFGKEGQAVFNFLKNKSGSEIWVLDKNPQIKIPSDVKSRLGKNYLSNLSRFDLIFRSPGIPFGELDSRLRGNDKTDKITSATKLFFEKCPCKIIGITGTKGKGTTATLLYNILKECGRDVWLAGNIGTPALDVLPKLKKDSLVVLEMSSFQLQDLKKSPAIAVVLDIFPDHLDYHKNYREYAGAKLNIAKHQPRKVFYFSDNSEAGRIMKYVPKAARRVKIDFQKAISSPKIGWIKKIKIPGEHNIRNAVMAYQVARYLKCPLEEAKKAILSFKGNEHRLELVKTIQGIKFYNDSASTNPLTTLAAVKSFKKPIILIAGGSDKNLNYKIWAEEFPKHNIKAVILMGKNKNKIIFWLPQTQKICDAVNLEEAVKLAKKMAKSGDIVLFSPGAASFDMFSDYAKRGQGFKNLIK